MSANTRRARPSPDEPSEQDAHLPPVRLPVEEALKSVRRVFTPLLAKFVERTQANEHNRIVFVSPEHGAGTTTLAACAALVMVRSFRTDVALIEANSYSPALDCYLGLSPEPGLLDVLDGRAKVKDALRNSQAPGLYALTAGRSREPQEGELASKPIRDLLNQTKRQHRYIMIDAPPVLEYPETTAILRHADEVILVTRAGKTTKKRAKAAIQLIQDTGTPIAGVFLNRYRAHRPFGIGRGQFE